MCECCGFPPIKKVELCGVCSETCPSVEIYENGVRIGDEERGWLRLKKEEWNLLVDYIRKGELSEL